MSTAATTLPLAPAVFRGVQSGYGVLPDFELWDATAQIGIHPPKSTLSRETIEALGYFVPPAPVRQVIGGPCIVSLPNTRY